MGQHDRRREQVDAAQQAEVESGSDFLNSPRFAVSRETMIVKFSFQSFQNSARCYFDTLYRESRNVTSQDAD